MCSGSGRRQGGPVIELGELYRIGRLSVGYKMVNKRIGFMNLKYPQRQSLTRPIASDEMAKQRYSNPVKRHLMRPRPRYLIPGDSTCRLSTGSVQKHILRRVPGRPGIAMKEVRVAWRQYNTRDTVEFDHGQAQKKETIANGRKAYCTVCGSWWSVRGCGFVQLGLSPLRQKKGLASRN